MSRSSIRRNVHFVDGGNDEVAGFWQNGSVTWAEMLGWMYFVFGTPKSEYEVFPCLEDGSPAEPVSQHGPAINLNGNTSAVQPGFYVLLSRQGSPIEMAMSQESALPRTLSLSLSGSDPRIAAFRDRVRERDGGCVVSGMRADPGDFDEFDAAHIYPCSHLDLWRRDGWADLIRDDNEQVGVTKIHSIQNGILLRKDLHSLFDKYRLAIDPEHGYRITVFKPDIVGVDGRIMAVNANYAGQHQPLRGLLKWHFRQVVLCNMKGRGPEYDWDEAFDPGDPIAQIADSKEGKLRFELTMAAKLNALLG